MTNAYGMHGHMYKFRSFVVIYETLTPVKNRATMRLFGFDVFEPSFIDYARNVYDIHKTGKPRHYAVFNTEDLRLLTQSRTSYTANMQAWPAGIYSVYAPGTP